MPRYTDDKPIVVMDTEAYPNYWSIAFRCVDSGKTRRFEQFNDSPLDREGILRFIQKARIISFNGNGYDIPMISLAVRGASNAALKAASDDIILAGIRSWEFERKYNTRLPSYLDHIDLMEVSPGSPQKPSLKIYAGRMHSAHMQDLPFDPDRVLTEEDVEALRSYHDNDLINTADMYRELMVQLALRASMSEQYGVDLRSKSDAQIAEAVIKKEIERITGNAPQKPDVRSFVFHYTPPAYISYKTEQLKGVLATVKSAKFVVGRDGVVRMPEELAGLKIAIGGSTYQIGIGGLHSTESGTTHRADADHRLLDRDVTSYYPNIILTTGLFPKHLGPVFLKVYRTIYERRLAAKNSGDKNTSETLKIVLNGSFGKFGSPYSALYAPELMIQTTVTGQLAILMLIERMELAGISVVSANTDGFVSRVPVKLLPMFDRIIEAWEEATAFMTEETAYRALHSRDVNSYVAITTNGKAKRKGAYTASGPGQPAASGLKKNPDCEITAEAAVEFFKNGTPVEQTIRACTDVRKFVTVRRVNGGAMKGETFVGKAIRIYYAKGEKGVLTYRTNGNTVPSSEGAKPLMTLPDALPADIDYDWYIREALAILEEVGLPVADPNFARRTGIVKAHLPEQKTTHLVDVNTGTALCGRRNANLRKPWVEAEQPRLCSKCASFI